MATRDSYAGDPASGDILTAANFKKLPGGWIGYDEVVSGQTTAATTELTLHTLTVNADASRKLRMVFWCGRVNTSVAGDTFDFRIKMDGTIVGSIASWLTPATTNSWPLVCYAVQNPASAGSKVIIVTVQRTAGTGTLTVNRSATNPGFLLVEDIGPAS